MEIARSSTGVTPLTEVTFSEVVARAVVMGGSGAGWSGTGRARGVVTREGKVGELFSREEGSSEVAGRERELH